MLAFELIARGLEVVLQDGFDRLGWGLLGDVELEAIRPGWVRVLREPFDGNWHDVG